MTKNPNTTKLEPLECHDTATRRLLREPQPAAIYRGPTLRTSPNVRAPTRLTETGCDAFTIAQLLGHSDIRVTMRYVRAVESSKRVAVEAVRLNSRKVGHVLVSWPKQPPVPAAVNG